MVPRNFAAGWPVGFALSSCIPGCQLQFHNVLYRLHMNTSVLATLSDTVLTAGWLAGWLQIVEKLGRRYNVGQVKQAIEFLSNEGHLYSTIDEQHFKSCGI